MLHYLCTRFFQQAGSQGIVPLPLRTDSLGMLIRTGPFSKVTSKLCRPAASIASLNGDWIGLVMVVIGFGLSFGSFTSPQLGRCCVVLQFAQVSPTALSLRDFDGSWCCNTLRLVLLSKPM